MSHLEELNQILRLDEEPYYAEDRFLDVEELIELLTEHDIPSLLEVWSNQSRIWRERFVHASRRIGRPVVQALLKEAVSANEKPEVALSLMTNLPRVASNSELNDSLVQFSAVVWATHPGLHRQVQMCTWSCGLSRRVLGSIGYRSWKEAGL